MKKNKLKKTVSVIKRKNIYYLTDNENKIQKFKPWLGDIFSFLPLNRGYKNNCFSFS